MTCPTRPRDTTGVGRIPHLVSNTQQELQGIELHLLANFSLAHRSFARFAILRSGKVEPEMLLRWRCWFSHLSKSYEGIEQSLRDSGYCVGWVGAGVLG